MKPMLTLLKDRPSAFSDVPSMADAGLSFEPLLRFRGFYTHKGVDADRLAYLEWAFARGFESEEFQAFNHKKYMHLIDSYRDTEGAKAMISNAITTYTEIYKKIGIIE